MYVLLAALEKHIKLENNSRFSIVTYFRSTRNIIVQ